jgi:hypothetical protein
VLSIGRKNIQPKSRSRLLVIPIISLVTTHLTVLKERTEGGDLKKPRSSQLSVHSQRLVFVRYLAGVLVLRMRNLTLRTIL